MRALVFLANKVDRDSVARILGQSEYLVETAIEGKAALVALDRDVPHVLVLGFYAGCHKLIRHARSLSGPRRTHIIVVFDKEPATEIPGVIAAGADDFCRRPLALEEVVARAEMPQRIARWTNMIPSGGDLLELAGASAEVRSLRGLRTMGSLAAEDLSQMLGAVDVTEGWAKELCGDDLRGAAIPMSLVSQRCEVRIGAALDSASIRSFASLVLGDNDPAESVLKDIARELANTAGGAVKRACLQEQVEFTTGLPMDETFASLNQDGAVRWTVTARSSGIRVGLFCKVYQRENVRLPAEQVREGMIVVHDIRNDAGALLVRAGTRLSLTSAESVGRTLGLMLIEIANAA